MWLFRTQKAQPYHGVKQGTQFGYWTCANPWLDQHRSGQWCRIEEEKEKETKRKGRRRGGRGGGNEEMEEE